MRRPLACISVVVAILSAGCGGSGGASGVEADLKKSGDELRKEAAAMSAAQLEKKMEEIDKYRKDMEKSAGKEPSQAEIEKASKLREITGIYGAQLTKMKIK